MTITNPRPFVSVIVPTYRRPQALDHCLGSLARQHHPQDRLEVVVVDDAGDDGLDEIVARHALRATLLRVPHGGPASARNHGASAARGEILAFIDDDCTADAGWIEALVDALAADRGAVVGGKVTNAVPDNPYARASQTLLGFLYHYYHEERRGLTPFFTTNNLAVHRETFSALGGFDASFTFASEDRDWSDRARDQARALIYAPAAIVHHAPQLTLAGFARLHYAYGHGAWLFHRVRAERGDRRFRVEPLSFYARMLMAPFAQRDPTPLRQSLLLLASQAIGALGYVHAAAARRTHQAKPAPRSNAAIDRGSERASPRVREARPDDAQA